MPTLAGVWSGTGDGVTVTVTLTQVGTTVSGTGTVAAAGSADIEVDGTFEHPDATLTISAPGFIDMIFTGTLSGNSLEGSLDGSGFDNEPITLTRQ